MKNATLSILMISFMAAAACAGAQAKERLGQFKSYAMDNNYFSCQVPVAWSLERDKDRDADYKIYEIQLLAPGANKAPTSIGVAFYAKDNEDFNDYADFVKSNSKNALGETKSKRENYSAPKDMTLAGRKAILLSRDRLVYLHPESKSDESVQLKEKLYVLPAKEGFYVLHFSAEAAAFAKNLPVFEKVAKSFKGLP